MTDITDQLAQALEDVLASAHPNSVEHPRMHAAWQTGIKAIEAYRASPIKGRCACANCGRRDGLDACVTDETWEKISRGRNILCLWCMDAEAAAQGIEGRCVLHFAGNALYATDETAALREENAMLRDMLKREVFERDAINNELRAECERLRQQLNSANQQQQPLKAI